MKKHCNLCPVDHEETSDCPKRRRTYRPRCPHCDARMHRMIYLGLPGWICDTYGCWTVGGLAGEAATVFPLESYDAHGDSVGVTFYVYEGSYWRALWRWLRGAPQ